jgi:putative NADH-flavin reductase
MAAGVGKVVAVVAATGQTGRHAVDLLVERGDRPIAIGRSEGKLAELFRKHGDKVQLRVAEMHDAPALTKALEGADAVITTSGLDVGLSMFSTDVYTTTARNVTAAMETHGIRKLVFMGTAVNTQPEDVVDRWDWVHWRVTRSILGRPITDQEEALEELRRHSATIDWVYVRPGELHNGPGGADLLDGFMGRGDIPRTLRPISRRDVAKFLVDQVNSDRLVHTAHAITPK